METLLTHKNNRGPLPEAHGTLGLLDQAAPGKH